MNRINVKKLLFEPLIIIFLLMILTKLYFIFFKFHFLGWDESVYLGIGKWIYSSGSIGIWESIRPLGLPLMIGIFWRLGLDYIKSADIIMLCFSLGAVWLSYALAKEVFNKKIGIIAAAMIFLTPIFFYNSFLIMTGIPSLFFTLLALYLGLRKRWILAGLFCAVAFFFRYPSGLMIIALNIILLYEFFRLKSRKQVNITNLIRLNSGFSIPIIIFFIINKLFIGSFFGALILASKHQSSVIGNIDGVLTSLLYYPYVILTVNLFLLFIIGTFFIRTKSKRFRFILTPLIIFLTYFTLIPHKQPRFALLFLPYLMILSSCGMFLLFRKLRRFRIIFYVLLLFLPIAVTHSLIIDYKLFVNIHNSEPDIVTEYYRYTDIIDITGPILTSDPVHAGYTDKKFIGYYNNITDAHEILDNDVNSVKAIIYTPASFPCNDALCDYRKRDLENKIESSGTLVMNISYVGQDKLIFLAD